MLFCRLLIFLKYTFWKNSFRNNIRVSKSLDSDQARLYVGPDLGPNCLQKLSADDTSRQRVKVLSFFVGPDLGPNCLQRLSADDSSRQRVKNCCCFFQFGRL